MNSLRALVLCVVFCLAGELLAETGAGRPHRVLPLPDGGLLLIEGADGGYASVLVRRDPKGVRRELARFEGEFHDIAVNASAAVIVVDYKAHRVDLSGGETETPELPEEWKSVAANREGFLLGGFGDRLMASADGRNWSERKFEAPGEGMIERLDLDGPVAIALRATSREENGWHINSSEICLRDAATGVWRKVAGLDGGSTGAPLHQLDWVGDRWLARGQSIIMTVMPTGVVATIRPEPLADFYAPMAGDELICREGGRWRMYLFTGVIESTDLTNWSVVKAYSHEGVDGLWFADADGAPQWYGVIGTVRQPGPLSWPAVVAALEKPKPAPAPVAAVPVKSAAKPSAPVIADADLVVPRAAGAPEPRTGLEFFNRGVKRFKEEYDNEGAIADFGRAADLGLPAAMYNFANLAMQGETSKLRANFAKAFTHWYDAFRAGYGQITEDVRSNADLDQGIAVLEAEGDLVKARRAFETASAAGHRFAKVILGEMYLHGLSVPYDLDKARDLFEQADNEEHGSTWAAKRLDHIHEGKTYIQIIQENRRMRDNMNRLNASFSGSFTPLPAATEIPSQATIDATIKGSPWTYQEIADALRKQVNHLALATAIRTDGGDIYAGEMDRLLALPEMAGQYEADTDLVGALHGEAKPGAGPWAREMARAAIAARRAQLPARVEWTDSLDLRRRAAQGDMTALYQVYTLNFTGRLPLGALPPVFADPFKNLPQRALAEKFAPAMWLSAGALESNTDKTKIDLAQAAVYYRASALAGEAEAAWQLAKLHHSPADHNTKQEGVAGNYLAAEYWYIEAGALARPGQKVGYISPEDCLYLLYSFRRPITKDGFEMDAGAASLRWARELLSRGGQLAENTKVALAGLQARNPGADVAKRLAELAPEEPTLTAQQITDLETAAGAGDAAAALKLGDAFATGGGVLQDDVAANRWFERAAKSGDVTAMRRLVQQYTTGRGVKVDVGQQRAWLARIAEAGDVSAWAELGRRSEGAERLGALQKGAEAGDAEALFELSDTWQYGRGGVEKDEAKFIDYAQRAAAAGSAKAMSQLGFFYNYSKKDDVSALKWYRMAVAAGDKKQRMVLAALLRGAKENAAAETLYRELAEEGDAAAQLRLGMWLFEQGREDEGIVWMRKVADGPPTTEQTLVAARVRSYDEEEKAEPGTIPWLERRARRGDADARFELARKIFSFRRDDAMGHLNTAARAGHAKATAWYYSIALTDRDKNWAPQWLEERVAENNSQAILIEGQLLSKSNLPEALKRIERAAELGNLEAKFQLGMARYQGQQVAQDRAGGLVLIGESAEGGLPAAQFTLGKGLLNGDVELAADPKRGVALLEKAAAQDWQSPVAIQALVLLGQVYESGQVAGIARNLTKALENFDRAAKLDPRNAQLQQHLNVLRQQHSLEMKMGGKI